MLVMPRAEAYGSSFVCQSVIMPRQSKVLKWYLTGC